MFSNLKGVHFLFQEQQLDKIELLSSSSQGSKKASIKDIVFDPRQRKRLLDSLNIVTTREKWQNLND